MALDKDKLKEGIKAAFLVAAQETESAELSAETLATALSIVIDTYIKAGVVNTTGSATAQTGKIT